MFSYNHVSFYFKISLIVTEIVAGPSLKHFLSVLTEREIYTVHR